MLRSLASLLGRHARRALPPSRAKWADAIQRETEHLEDDWQALRWASGSVVAAYRERLGAMDLTALGAGRVIVMIIFAGLALRDFFATLLTVAYRTGALGVAERLGRTTAGDDFRRFIPLMESVPVWLHTMWVSAGVLYLLGIAGIALRMHRVHLFVVVAVSVDLLAEVLSRPFNAAAGVVVNPDQSMMAQATPFVLPLVLAVILWQADRRTRASNAMSA
jgi:hypothetical protein